MFGHNLYWDLGTTLFHPQDMHTFNKMGPNSIHRQLVALFAAFACFTVPLTGSSDTNPVSSLSNCNTMSLLSLNVAHGRGEALNQIFLDDGQIGHNLASIAAVLENRDADLVALQEADRPSWWSGNLDHVRHLATLASYPEAVHSTHAKSFLFDYGTALLSRRPFNEILHHTFEPSPPTMSKGFTLGRFSWRCDSPSETTTKSLDIDVVSVHLDFSRESVRSKQIDELVAVLEHRDNPLILMGDLNSDWFDGENLVSRLSSELNLQIYHPESRALGTYPDNGRRLDWILVSPQFSFINYTILPDPLSDHAAVLATVALNDFPDS